MKVEINIDPKIKEITVQIIAKSLNHEVLMIQGF
jgi:hypothetical protein